MILLQNLYLQFNFIFVKTRKHNVAHWSKAEFDNFTKYMHSTYVPCAFIIGLRVLNDF